MNKTVKTKTVFVCSECGRQSPRWLGQCPDCGNYNTIHEEIIQQSTNPVSNNFSTITPRNLLSVDLHELTRLSTGINELDRVLGGGIVPGSITLVSGDPGIGKSTILLQMCKTVTPDKKIFYVSGEESAQQIKLRAERLGIHNDNIFLVSDSNIESICNSITNEKPDIVIIDSIQTMNLDTVSSSPGSVTQVKECTALIIKTCKNNGSSAFLVGHVNKEGTIAGPKVLEHMVDTVLYFEGDRNLDLRILRAIKNRFGSTNEIGVFEMHGNGLIEIQNPSKMFLDNKPQNVPGISAGCTIEGSRPIITEIQSLITKSFFPVPRRTASGFEINRLNLILAVLEKRCGMYFGNQDVYLNVIGGLRLNEPASDLPIAVSLASGFKDFVIQDDTIFMGEIGLAGEIRNITRVESRIKEAVNFGFKRCFIPSSCKLLNKNYDIEIKTVSTLNETFSLL